jgi:L-asparagine transporter-like permease
MSKFSKWVRNIHRWLAIPLIIALILTLITTIAQGATPDWVATFGIFSILSLLITGLYMFVQHYLSRLRRSMRNKQRESGTVEV